MYEQKIGGLYSGSVENSRFIKTHEEASIPKDAPVVTVSRDLGECLCSAADYIFEGSLKNALTHWKDWFGGIDNYFHTLERLDVLIIHYDEIEGGIERLVERYQIKPDIQPLSPTEWNAIVAANRDHFLCAKRCSDQSDRIAKANQMIRGAFPEVVTICRRIGWD